MACAVWVAALAAAVYAAFAAAVWVADGAMWAFGLLFVLFISHAALAARAHKEVRRGHRQARGDRGDQGPFAVGGTISYPRNYAGRGTINHSSGTTFNFTGTVIAGPRPDIADLPTRQSDEPIKAWKQARIELRNGTPTFAGVSRGGLRYKAQDVARCSSYRVHDEFCPQLDCSCGFYALKESAKPTEGIVLEVELYGTVIVCERGYRAERQRVLSVTLPAKCANALCNQSASLVTFAGDSLVGLCADHAALVERSPLLTPAPVADLAGVLGTEVRFAVDDAEGA